jgi:hypothetical protein
MVMAPRRFGKDNTGPIYRIFPPAPAPYPMHPVLAFPCEEDSETRTVVFKGSVTFRPGDLQYEFLSSLPAGTNVFILPELPEEEKKQIIETTEEEKKSIEAWSRLQKSSTALDHLIELKHPRAIPAAPPLIEDKSLDVWSALQKLARPSLFDLPVHFDSVSNGRRFRSWKPTSRQEKIEIILNEQRMTEELGRWMRLQFAELHFFKRDTLIKPIYERPYRRPPWVTTSSLLLCCGSLQMEGVFD